MNLVWWSLAALALHEAAHVAAAKVLGIRVVGLHMGVGRVVARWRWLHVRRVPLGAEGRAARLLQRLVEQAREKRCLRGWRAGVDSSPVAAHAAARTRVQLLREGRRRLWQAVRDARPEAASDLQALA